ncbi:hypothetical protein ACFUJR_27875 [Streptomyces sp. NPDC057271]|uniref:hypothetical protein n=1 Tax=unclassified Streptomyces TaxID=2593676 RepID=UPI0036300513
MTRRVRPRPCDHLGPHGLQRARLYPCGWCCDRHTPAARAGRPESPPGPGWPIHRPPEPEPDTDTQELTRG